MMYTSFSVPTRATTDRQELQKQGQTLIDEWAYRFGKSKYKIVPSEVIARLLAEIDGGAWFKRMFIILVETCLYENATDNYVKPKIMDVLCDLSNIRDHNWCDHIITCLLRTHERWAFNKNKKFNDPSVFIAISYILMQC